jgi:membrane protease YdiL (CAAX protease family)
VRLADAAQLEIARGAWGSALRWFPFLAVFAFLGVTALELGGAARWLAVFGTYALLSGLAAASQQLPWRSLLRPTVGGIAAGLALAAIMLGVALVLVPALTAWFPEFLAPAAGIYGWADEAHPALLVAIILGEDIVWRGAVPIILAGRLGDYGGAIAAGALFAAAHLVLGPPVLWFAAFLAGTAWSALALRTRSLIPVFIAHLAWDAGMVYFQRV